MTLFVTQSLYIAGSIAMSTLMALVAVTLSGSKSAAGIPPTMSAIAQAMTAYPLGIFMDRFGRRRGVLLAYLWGTLGAVLGTVAIAHASYPLFLLASILLGMAQSGAQQTRFIAAEGYPEEQRAAAIGKIVFAGTIGAIVGPLLVGPAGYVTGQLGVDQHAGPWLAASGLMGLSLGITFIFLHPDPRHSTRQTFPDLRTTSEMHVIIPASRPMSNIWRNAQVQLAAASMLVGQAAMVTIMVVTPLHMAHHAHGSSAISVVIMAHTLGMFGLSGVIGKLIDRVGRVQMVLAGALLLLVAAVLASSASQVPILAVAVFVLGLGWNFSFISGTSILSNSLTPGERGRVQGVMDSLVALASTLGNLSAGIVFAQGGYLAVSLVGLGLALGLLGMVINHKLLSTPRSHCRLTIECQAVR